MEVDKDAYVQMERHVDGPPWRWALAQRTAERDGAASLVAADELVRQATDYIRLAALGETGALLAAEKHPNIQAAVALWGNPVSQQLKTMVIGGCPHADIAARLGLSEPTIQIAESLLFDVRPALHATGWITSAVILPEERAGHADLATRLRAAYFGGPLVAQVILDTAERLPFVEADRLFDQSILLHMKAQAAMAVPLRDEGSALKFLKLYTDFQHKTAELDLAKEKFRHPCEKELQQRQPPKPPTEPAEDRGIAVSSATEQKVTQAAQEVTRPRSPMGRDPVFALVTLSLDVKESPGVAWRQVCLRKGFEKCPCNTPRSMRAWRKRASPTPCQRPGTGCR